MAGHLEQDGFLPKLFEGLIGEVSDARGDFQQGRFAFNDPSKNLRLHVPLLFEPKKKLPPNGLSSTKSINTRMNIRESMNILNESTGLECEFVETAPGVWYSLLEDDYGNRWDWRDTARCFGPFPSYGMARAHLAMNFANPGGHSVSRYEGGEPDAQMQKLMSEAPANMKHTRMPDPEDAEDYEDRSAFENFQRWGKPLND